MQHRIVQRRVLFATGLVVWSAWSASLLAGLGGESVGQAVSNVGLTVAALAAAASCGIAGSRRRDRDRRVWWCLGGFALLWGLGQLTWTVYETLLHREVPFPSLADVGYLAAVPCAAVGLLSIPSGAQSLTSRLRTILDGAMVAGSVLLISWLLVLGPVARAGADGNLAFAISLAYPISDVILVTIVLLVMLRGASNVGAASTSLRLLGMGLIAFAFADSGFTYLALTGGYASGNFIDIGWFSGFCLIAIAALTPGRFAARPDEPRREGAVATLMPYVAVVGALVTSVFAMLTHGRVDAFVSWVRSSIIAALVLRQILTLLENLALTRHLESRVEERTAELSASQQRFAALFEHSSDVVSIVDHDGVVLYQSESVERVFGYSASELIGRPIDDLFDIAGATRLRQTFAEVSNDAYRSLVIELPALHKNGRHCDAETTITNLLDTEAVGGFVLNTRDISERKQLEQQLLQQAFHDSLTTLANRALFTDRVEHALRRSRGNPTVAVLFLDLDGFKQVNDSLGHVCGDQLLAEVAARLGACVRDADTVARLGGDEFSVLVEDAVHEQDAVLVAERLAAALAKPFLVDGREIWVGASIGIALAGTETDCHQLLRNADLAMYRAKAAGKGRSEIYHPDMHAHLLERVELEADLRKALERGELLLHYQPTVSLRTGAPIGFEALVRWEHPERGLIGPDQFIPIAEETGMIRPIGRWVLEEACRQAQAWRLGHAEFDEMTMGVNISGKQIQHGDLVSEVQEVLHLTGLPPRCLVLEVTETVLIEHTERNRVLLARLRELGVRVAIDDFGTGYSSLSYLHQFPADILKVDRSFVQQLAQGADEAELVSTILQLAHGLHMETVAEGIEALSQFDALKHLGCEYGQGFYILRPAPAGELDQFVELLAQSSRDPRSRDASGGPEVAVPDITGLREDAV